MEPDRLSKRLVLRTDQKFGLEGRRLNLRNGIHRLISLDFSASWGAARGVLQDGPEHAAGVG